MKYPERWMNWLAGGLRIITLGMVGAMGLYALVGLRILRIPDGMSLMEPDFLPGETVLAKPRLPFTRITRGDVVVYQTGAGSSMARVAGLPGETVEVVGTELKVNGAPQDYPYLVLPENHQTGLQIGPIKLNSREYFLLADNPWESQGQAGAWSVVPLGALNSVILMHF
jgi:signal peptidase I